MYQGKDERRPQDMSATVYPVWRLLGSLSIYHGLQYNILYTDNWYTSLPLVVMLAGWGIHLVGTVRVNRAGLPEEGIFKKVGRDKKKWGDMKCMKKTLLNGWPCYFTSWMDSKPVHVLHTISSYRDVVPRLIKNAQGFFTGEKEEIPQPTIISDYNQWMGETDHLDQCLSYYRTAMRVKKWQPRLFMHFLNVAVVNAHPLYTLTVNDLLQFTE